MKAKYDGGWKTILSKKQGKGRTKLEVNAFIPFIIFKEPSNIIYHYHIRLGKRILRFILSIKHGLNGI